MKHRWRLPPKQVLPALILLIGGLSAAAILLWPASDHANLTQLQSCKNTKDFNCYKQYFEAKTNQADPLTALADLRAVYNTDAFAKAECHQMTHIIGRTAFTKYGSLSAAYAKGDAFCWSGYYHGITEQAIGKLGIEGVKTKANTICSELVKDKPYSFDHYNCAHGLGHGFLTVASFDLFKGLQTCDLLQDNWERESCYGGVYMENIMVVARGEGTTKYLKPEQPLYPCTEVDATYKYQCYLMQTSYALQQNDYNFTEAFRLCREVADAEYSDTCYQSIGRDASGSTVSDITKTKANCDAAPDTNALRYCMFGAVRDIISYHHNNTQAKEFCKTFAAELHTDCNSEVTTYYETFK